MAKRSNTNVYQGELERRPDSTEQSCKRSKPEVSFAEILFEIPVNYQENKNDKKKTMENVVKHIVALLNSGGGVVRICEYGNDERTITKYRDMWMKTLEERLLVDILTQDEYSQCVHHSSKFPYYYLFVKKCKRVCTQSYNMKIPLQRCVKDATYDDVLRILNGSDPCDPPSESSSLEMTDTEDMEYDSGYLEHTPNSFADQVHEEFHYEKKLTFDESDNVQFKLIKNGDATLDSLLKGCEINHLERYVSAFANHRGGKVYFGVDDNGIVKGQHVPSESARHQVKEMVEKIINRKNGNKKIRIWGEPDVTPKYGVHWTVEFPDIVGASERCVIVVEIFPFRGGMFLECPLAWKVDESSGEIVQMGFQEWKNLHKTEKEDTQEMFKRFERLDITNKRVYQLKDMAKNFAKKVFPAQRGLGIVPENFAERFKAEKDCINKLELELKQTYSNDDGFAIMDKSWAVNVGIEPAPSEVVCDVFVMSHNIMPAMMTITRKFSLEVLDYNRKLAKKLKLALVNKGGCLECFGIDAHVIKLSQIDDEMKIPSPILYYPAAYQMTKQLFKKLRESLVIVLAGFECSTFNPAVGANFLYVLTPEQYEITIAEDPFVLVHAPPGTGKTLAAIERIKRLRKLGVSQDKILYICENKPLASYVGRMESICRSLTRAKFMKQIQSDGYSSFDAIQHIVVDEAQNFSCETYEDWFKSLIKILGWQNALKDEHFENTSLCILCDDLQKIRREFCGLRMLDSAVDSVSITTKPLPIKYKLCSVIRNCQKIFEQWNQIALKSGCKTGRLEIAHDYEGQEINEVKLPPDADEKKIFTKVEEVIDKILTEKSFNARDIAVLCKTQVVADCLRVHFSKSGMRTTSAETFPRRCLVVDSVRRFSGLEAPVVIAVTPEINEGFENRDKFMIFLYSRAMVEFYYIDY